MLGKLPPSILLLESDEAAASSLSRSIERNWFDVLRAYSVKEAEQILSVSNVNAIVISVREGAGSEDFVRRLRSIEKFKKSPLIFALEESESLDYELSGDKYSEIIRRPFTPHQLISAVKSLMIKSEPVFQDKILRYKDLGLDVATYKLRRGDKSIHLGPKEFKLLHLFFKEPKKIHSRVDIISHVWNDEDVNERTVDVHINRLRKLIKSGKEDYPLIKTIRSTQKGKAGGYCLSLPGEID